jgi:hypothetical protein
MCTCEKGPIHCADNTVVVAKDGGSTTEPERACHRSDLARKLIRYVRMPSADWEISFANALGISLNSVLPP